VQEDTAEEEVEHGIATDNKFEEEESEEGEIVEEEFVNVRNGRSYRAKFDTKDKVMAHI
jgi:hypothetical protein